MSDFKFQRAGPGRGRDGHGNRKFKMDIKSETKQTSSKECLKEFKTLEDGQQKLFIEVIMKELTDSELQILCGTLGNTLLMDLKKGTSSMETFYIHIENLTKFNVGEFLVSPIQPFLHF